MQEKNSAIPTLPSYPPHLFTVYRHVFQALALRWWVTKRALVEIIRHFQCCWIYFPSSSGTKVNGESGKGFVIPSPASSNSEAVRSNQERAQRESAASDGAERHRRTRRRKQPGEPRPPETNGRTKNAQERSGLNVAACDASRREERVLRRARHRAHDAPEIRCGRP